MTKVNLMDLTVDDVNSMTDEQLTDLTYQSIDAICYILEEKGVPLELIDVVLLSLFGMRMSENASRDEYEEMLEDALNDPWIDGPTYH